MNKYPYSKELALAGWPLVDNWGNTYKVIGEKSNGDLVVEQSNSQDQDLRSVSNDGSAGGFGRLMFITDRPLYQVISYSRLEFESAGIFFGETCAVHFALDKGLKSYRIITALIPPPPSYDKKPSTLPSTEPDGPTPSNPGSKPTPNEPS